MSDSGSSDNIEHKAYKALPRDENQEIHKKPRIFIHRPTEGDAEATEQARQQASYFDAARTIQAEDFTKVHEKPCVRNALLPAIGGGTVIGAGRLVFGGSILMACNWASGSFVTIALGAYQLCQRRRAIEKDGIRRAVEVLDKKQAMKNMQEQAAKGEKGAPQATSTITKAIDPTGPPGSTATGSSIPGGIAGQSPQDKQGVSFWQTFKFW